MTSGSRDGNGRKLHPTQKPEALLARVILASSRPDDLVLDPFCGTGTTAAVARRLGRRCIGIEREATYAAAAEQRVAAVEPLPVASLASFMTAREAPRVPFAALIERGLVVPGAKLCDIKRSVKALVRADGAIVLGEIGRLDPSYRCAGAGSRGLQRLGFLASGDRRGAGPDRRAARRDPGGAGPEAIRGSTSRRVSTIFGAAKRAVGARRAFIRPVHPGY